MSTRTSVAIKNKTTANFSHRQRSDQGNVVGIEADFHVLQQKPGAVGLIGKAPALVRHISIIKWGAGGIALIGIKVKPNVIWRMRLSDYSPIGMSQITLRAPEQTSHVLAIYLLSALKQRLK